ncbi:MAG: DUF362 domain-containing protein [Deltaproteobacteria bacterium]|nr:DUF362 domain-containing protein [Deltaproteobacteria bacterium]
MKPPSSDHTVLLRRCEDYEPDVIEALVRDGMDSLGYRPRGKVFVKPNVVFAGPPALLANHAFTHPTLLGAAVLALAAETGTERIDIGEKSGIGFPTRHCYQNAGYYDELGRIRRRAACPVDLYCMDEDRRDTVFVGGKVHDRLRLARRMARADTKVYLPKLKCHCVSNMTGAVKLNIGICCDDDRSIRHDFMLNEKIVDLLAVGWPDFVVMDAIDVGVGNEVFPKPRKLGLVLMGTNPVAVDLVAARLLGFERDDVPYLKVAAERGYQPGSLDEVTLIGDVTSVAEVDEAAKRLLPYDDEYTAWQDVEKELRRLQSPMRFFWGPYRHGNGDLCRTGCVMGLKMFLATYERYGGAEAFAAAKPVVFVIGRVDEEIDARGEDVFLLGSCARAQVRNAKEIVPVDKCFCTASDMTFGIGHRLGMPAPLTDAKLALQLVGGVARASLGKVASLRYAQDVGHFLANGLIRKV